jgi:hypothetical protein
MQPPQSLGMFQRGVYTYRCRRCCTPGRPKFCRSLAGVARYSYGNCHQGTNRRRYDDPADTFLRPPDRFRGLQFHADYADAGNFWDCDYSGSRSHGHLRSTPRTYQLTAPSDGTLVTRLTFDSTVENGAKLKLTIGECATPQPNTSCPSAKSFQGSEPNWSPVVGRVAVSAGRTYRVIVEEGLSPWDYHFNQPFELIAAVE